MKLATVAGSRLLSVIPTLLLATFVVFILQRLIPGDAAQSIAGEYATPERVAQIRSKLGLDRPMLVQYGEWIGNAFTGDLGTSLRTGESVTALVFDRLPLTLILTFASLIIAILIGVPAGIWAASKVDTAVDRAVTTVATFGLAVPNFWLGMMMMILFALNLGWLPGPGGPMLSQDSGEALKGLILPSVALGLVGGAEICRQIRSAMIENLTSDYVRTHKAKGLGQVSIVWKHALKNSSLPLATIIGLQISRLLGATVVIEAVFGLNGIGSLVVAATNQRDYTILQAVVFVLAVLVLLTNLIVDVAYRLLDPRIR